MSILEEKVVENQSAYGPGVKQVRRGQVDGDQRGPIQRR